MKEASALTTPGWLRVRGILDPNHEEIMISRKPSVIEDIIYDQMFGTGGGGFNLLREWFLDSICCI